MPVVFTIGPEDSPASLQLYARLLATNMDNRKHIDELVIGVVEGETRVLAASLTMEEVFKERKFFKEHVMDGINSELKQFGNFILITGMVVYNANVRQMEDTPGSEYFSYLRMKTQEGAINQAKSILIYLELMLQKQNIVVPLEKKSAKVRQELPISKLKYHTI
jgi:flotillin